MAALQRFNGIISWISYEVFGSSPEYLTAQQARKVNDINIPRGSNTKKLVLEWVVEKYPELKIEYTHKKALFLGVLNKHYFQKDLLNITRKVKNSNLPANIPKERTHLANTGISAKL